MMLTIDEITKVYGSDVKIVPDRNCPTYCYPGLVGWRRLLSKYLFMPRQWFKTSPKYPVGYLMPDGTFICSPENFMKLKEICIK
jgi:hypothetical protein